MYSYIWDSLQKEAKILTLRFLYFFHCTIEVVEDPFNLKFNRCTYKIYFQNKTIQLSDLKSGSALSKRPLSSGKRELHGYDGPLQYLSQGNPDSMTTVQVGV